MIDDCCAYVCTCRRLCGVTVKCCYRSYEGVPRRLALQYLCPVQSAPPQQHVCPILHKTIMCGTVHTSRDPCLDCINQQQGAHAVTIGKLPAASLLKFRSARTHSQSFTSATTTTGYNRNVRYVFLLSFMILMVVARAAYIECKLTFV